MRNIIAVSMIGNEIDIIELFINHTISIVDKFLVYSHNSFDGTYEFLKELSENELKDKLYVFVWEPVEYSQSEAMTELAKKAFNEFNADIVIPIDADEFVVTEEDDFNKDKIRKLFEEIQLEKVYNINSYDCKRENFKKFFVDCNDKFYKNSIPDTSNKIIICKNNFMLGKEIEIAQGNHCLKYIESNKVVNSEHINSIHYDHFRIRSKNQFKRKYVLGSLSNICKFGEKTRKGWHWLANMEQILNNRSSFSNKLEFYKSTYNLKSFKNLNLSIQLNKSIKKRSFECLLIQLAKKISTKYFDLKGILNA